MELTRGALVAESDATLLYNALTLFANIVPEAIATEVLQERLVLRRLCELMAYRQPDVACAAIDLVAEVASFDTDATKCKQMAVKFTLGDAPEKQDFSRTKVGWSLYYFLALYKFLDLAIILFVSCFIAFFKFF